jgi:hypothetical protein
MPSVLIVGTNHIYQREGGDVSAHVTGEFRQYLRQAVTSNEAAAIAEEMSVTALVENGLDNSVAQLIASELGIPHALVDPNPDERDRLGIRQRNDIELIGFQTGWDRAEIESKVRQSYEVREGFWASRLSDLGVYPVLFICGAAHVESFQDKLLTLGHDVAVLADNWLPSDGA